MLLAKVECKNATVEKLAECLSETTEPGFTVWLYDKKVYAIFKVNSLSALKAMIESFKACNIKYKFFRIQEI